MNKKFFTSLIVSIALSLLCTAIALLIAKHFSCVCGKNDEEAEAFDDESLEESEA